MAESRQPDPDKTRAKILSAAMELFAEKGYHGAKMAEISRKAEVSAGLAYHYFQGKEEILDAILQKNVEIHRPLFVALKQGRPGVSGIIEILLPIIEEHARFIRLNLALILQPRALGKKRRSLEQFFLKIQREIHTVLEESGTPRAREESQLLLAVVLGLVLGRTMELRGFRPEEIRELLGEKYGDSSKRK